MSEILIVDDMASNRYILRSLLEEAGYRVREATDGLQAVDAATEFPPDLVLMDINMPVMDGYEACRRIKQLPGQWCLPVLFISTNSGIGALEQAFQAGGCDYVSKPFHQLEVLARVQNQLRLKELGRQQAKVQLYQSLFQLTAGIAHEINTPIGIGITASSLIHGAGDLLASAVQNGMLGQRLLQQQLTDIKEGTELVESSLRRVALLVTRFKELTRDQTELPATPFAVQKSLRKLLQAFTPEFLIARVNADLGGEEVTLSPRVAVSRPGAGAHQEQHGARLQGAGGAPPLPAGGTRRQRAAADLPGQRPRHGGRAVGPPVRALLHHPARGRPPLRAERLSHPQPGGEQPARPARRHQPARRGALLPHPAAAAAAVLSG